MIGQHVQRRASAACLLAAAVLSLVSNRAGATARSPLWTGRTERVSVGPHGEQAGPSQGVDFPAISANGRYVAFTTDARLTTRACSDLQKNYGLGSQIYLRDLASQITELISVSPDGCPGGGKDGSSGNATSPVSMSTDGRWVAFVSGADNLVPGFRPTGPNTAIYLRDRVTRRTVAVSIGYDGKPNNAIADHPSISADGRYVAFDSGASNLVRGDNLGHGDNLAPNVYVRDMRTGRTERVVPQRQAWHGGSLPSISANGRYVAFYSDDPTLAGPPNYGELLPHTYIGGPGQVYVYDRATRRIEIVSRSDSGLTGNGGSDPGTSGRAISADGRYVVFASHAMNFGPPNDIDQPPIRGELQDDRTSDIYVWDRTAKHLTKISAGPGGWSGDFPSSSPAISADGRSVAYISGANNLGDVDLTVPVMDYLPVQHADTGYDVYLWDMATGTNRLVSRSTEGTQGDLSSYNAVVSGDGRTVAFVSDAANLVTDDTNGQADVFAYHAS